MKIIPVLAAAAALFVITPASAAVVPSSSTAPLVAADAPQTSVRISVGDQRRGYQRRHHGRRAYWRRNCRSYWRHGRRVQTCRRVRYWR